MTQTANNPLIAVEIDGITQNMPMIEVAETNTANSLVVAQYFGRRHTLVISDVEELLNNESPIVAEFAAKHFLKDEYKDSLGRMKPIYHMTQSGFAKLVSRWNGREAEEFMVRYIERFDSLAAENTQLLEQRLEQQREAYRQLKGELGSDLAEFYTNKLAQVETDNVTLKHDIQNLRDQVATLKPSKEDRHTLQAQAADATAKDMLKLLNAKAKQIRAHIKSITGWMKLNEHEYDYTLLNATEGIDAIVKHWAH